MWKRILVPHDFSHCAERALAVAVDLARQGEGTILLVHVCPLPPNLPRTALVTLPGSATTTTIAQALIGGAQRELDAVAASLQARGVSVQTRTRMAALGGAAPGLLEAVREWQPDAIVMGTHGRTGLAHLFLGSVAEKVLRAVDVPVVTVRSNDEALHPTREQALAEDELAG